MGVNKRIYDAERYGNKASEDANMAAHLMQIVNASGPVETPKRKRPIKDLPGQMTFGDWIEPKPKRKRRKVQPAWMKNVDAFSRKGDILLAGFSTLDQVRLFLKLCDDFEDSDEVDVQIGLLRVLMAELDRLRRTSDDVPRPG